MYYKKYLKYKKKYLELKGGSSKDYKQNDYIKCMDKLNQIDKKKIKLLNEIKQPISIDLRRCKARMLNQLIALKENLDCQKLK